MNWITIVSISSNIIMLAVYFKIPEFFQSFLINRIEHDFTEKMNKVKYRHEENINIMSAELKKEYQNIEHDFTIKLNTFKKKVDMLPELYNKVVIAVNDYNEISNLQSFEYASLKDLSNFINMNRFYIDKDIRETASSIEEVISGILDKAFRYDDKTLKNDYGNEICKIKELILELELQIETVLND